MAALAGRARRRLGVEQERVGADKILCLIEIARPGDAHRLDHRNQLMPARKMRHLPRRFLAVQLHRADLRRLVDQLVEPRHGQGRHHPRLDPQLCGLEDQRLRGIEIDIARARLDHDETDHVGARLDRLG